MISIDFLLSQLEDTTIATLIREGDNLFPALESIHVLAIALVFGSIAIVDLRLLGINVLKQSLQQVIQWFIPITWLAFACAACTGVLLFMSNASTYAINVSFQLKFVAMFCAGLNMLIFQFRTYQKIDHQSVDTPLPQAARAAGALSLLFWCLVVGLGRWIGFTTQL